MLVHKKKRSPYQVQVPLTSLIDIVFLLLVYFLLTTNFLTEEGIDIKLPEATASKEHERSELTIFVDKKGKIFFEQAEVTIEELENRLRDAISKTKDQMVIVKADREAIIGTAVKVMDIAKRLGAKRLGLATERPEE